MHAHFISYFIGTCFTTLTVAVSLYIDVFQLLEVKAPCMYKRRERWKSQ